ncbi:unnamed protein product [Leuciscus chuanchicus]
MVYFIGFVSLCLSVSVTVVVPHDQIVAHVGSTVTLPCWISPPENAEALEIRWYRQDQFSNPVLFYQHGKIQDVQEESYRNRSSLTLRSDLSGGLKDGDVSLRLEKLRIQDEGSFHCYVSGEKSYDSGEVVLKVTALGSAPVLFPQPLDDGRVNISCKSSGWYPEPNVTWMSDERTVLLPGGVSRSRGADEMFSVHSWTTISHSDAQLVSCSISLKTGEFREGRLNIQAIISSDSSDPWKALFFTLFICALLGLVGLILYIYRHKQTGKKQADQTFATVDRHPAAGHSTSFAAFTAVLLSHSGAPYPFLITSVRRRDTSKREISNEALFQMPRINCASSEALSSVETVTSSALPVWSVTMQKLHSLRAAALNVTRWISPPCGLDPSSRSLSLCLSRANCAVHKGCQSGRSRAMFSTRG